MQLEVCVVRDSAVDAYMQPFYVNHTGGAIRGFTDQVNDRDSPVFKHPDDYELYWLGYYDDKTATFTCEEPKLLCRGKDVKIRD